jgi:hypothetical protein
MTINDPVRIQARGPAALPQNPFATFQKCLSSGGRAFVAALVEMAAGVSPTDHSLSKSLSRRMVRANIRCRNSTLGVPEGFRRLAALAPVQVALGFSKEFILAGRTLGKLIW